MQEALQSRRDEKAFPRNKGDSVDSCCSLVMVFEVCGDCDGPRRRGGRREVFSDRIYRMNMTGRLGALAAAASQFLNPRHSGFQSGIDCGMIMNFLGGMITDGQA